MGSRREFEKERIKESRECAALAKEAGFPLLEGTSAQCQWANTIRWKVWSAIPEDEEEKMRIIFEEMASSKFWIDNRNNSPEMLLSLTKTHLSRTSEMEENPFPSLEGTLAQRNFAEDIRERKWVAMKDEEKREAQPVFHSALSAKFWIDNRYVSIKSLCEAFHKEEAKKKEIESLGCVHFVCLSLFSLRKLKKSGRYAARVEIDGSDESVRTIYLSDKQATQLKKCFEGTDRNSSSKHHWVFLIFTKEGRYVWCGRKSEEHDDRKFAAERYRIDALENAKFSGGSGRPPALSIPESIAIIPDLIDEDGDVRTSRNSSEQDIASKSRGAFDGNGDREIAHSA